MDFHSSAVSGIATSDIFLKTALTLKLFMFSRKNQHETGSLFFPVEDVAAAASAAACLAASWAASGEISGSISLPTGPSRPGSLLSKKAPPSSFPGL